MPLPSLVLLVLCCAACGRSWTVLFGGASICAACCMLLCAAASYSPAAAFLPCHRSNVMLSADWRASISDLGVAQVVGCGARPPLGYNEAYAAPEQLLGACCTLAADIYRYAGLQLPCSCLSQRVWTVSHGCTCLPGTLQLSHSAAQECAREQLACVASLSPCSFGVLLVALLTQLPVIQRDGWRLPCAPQECPQVRALEPAPAPPLS